MVCWICCILFSDECGMNVIWCSALSHCLFCSWPQTGSCYALLLAVIWVTKKSMFKRKLIPRFSFLSIPFMVSYLHSFLFHLCSQDPTCACIIQSSSTQSPTIISFHSPLTLRLRFNLHLEVHKHTHHHYFLCFTIFQRLITHPSLSRSLHLNHPPT